MPSAVFAISQTWYLTDIASGSNYVMQKGSSGGGSTSITVSGSGGNVIWHADEPSTYNVGFLSGNWTGQLTRTGDNAARSATMEVGIWNGISFTAAGSGDASFANKAWTTPISISAAAFDVPEGQWLALRFTNIHSPASKTVSIETAGGSYLVSPSTDPGYPVPDVGAWLLYGTGLGVVALIILRLKKVSLSYILSG